MFLSLTALCALSGCQFLLGLEKTEVAVYRVRVVATAIEDPVAVRLESTGVNVQLTVDSDGMHMFEAQLEDGASYSVQLVNPSAPCDLDNHVGTLQGADAEVTLSCALIDDIAIGSVRVPDLGFAPAQLEYRAEVSLLQDSVTVTAVAARPGVELEIAGQPAVSGEPSEALPLGLGENSIAVIARHPASGAEVMYTVIVDRAGDIVQAAYGKASNTDVGDQFGWSVALSATGDTLAVGAYLEDSAAMGVNDDNQADDTAADSGAVYVFRRAGSTWAQEAYVKASNTGAQDQFGFSVALSATGDTLAVGAWLEDSAAVGVNNDQANNAAPGSGAVYVFQRSGTDWIQEAYVKASNTGMGDWFGRSVALSATGDTLAVGAIEEDSAATGVNNNDADNTAPGSGAVYVFRRSGTDWDQQAYVKASNTDAGDQFGSSVALSASGDTLAVGTYLEASAATGVNNPNDADNTAPVSGAVYVFRRSGTDWAHQAYIKASNTDENDFFGVSVALSANGDTLAVGAPGEDSAATGVNNDQADDTASNSGAVYVFQRSGSSWDSNVVYIKASNTGVDDRFGFSVALSATGDTLAVGANTEASAATGVGGDQADDAASQSGAVYAFRRSGAAWAQETYVKASNTGANDEFGRSVALSATGDTLAVGAWGEDSMATGLDGNQSNDTALDSGAVYLFH